MEMIEYPNGIVFRIIERIQITADLSFATYVVGKTILSAGTLKRLQTYHIQFL